MKMNSEVTYMDFFSKLPKLGLGMMRLPVLDGKPDLERVCEMVDAFMAAGFTYFDTAYGYHSGLSETCVRDAVVKRYPREKFVLADKLPSWLLNEPGDPEKFFREQLERTQAGYFDCYLLHAVGKGYVEKYQQTDPWTYLLKMKDEGFIRHLGFSFHDTPEFLEEFLIAHPEAEFVQLQLNYADWESENVQSRRCYEVARKYNKAVIVMEPVKGGSLAALTPQAREILEACTPSLSPAAWALRYCGSLEGVEVILSGMSNLEQVQENIVTMANFVPLSDKEKAALADVVDVFRKTPTVPCTACRYCVDGCPASIPIPDVFSVYNTDLTYGTDSSARYRGVVKEKGAASACVGCGQCEGVCPQHIEIIEALRKISEKYDR